jgi:hypothetical protein
MGMRPMTLVVWVVLAAGCGQAATVGSDGSQRSQPAGTAVAGRGVSLSLLDGWHADVVRGRIQFQDYLGQGDPAAGQVHAFLSEYSPALAASDGFPYPELAGPLTLTPGEFPSAQFARDADQGPGITAAARFFTVAGRRFEVFAQYGGDPPPSAAVAELNDILATFHAQPGDFYPGTVNGPAFEPASGWYIGGDAPIEARPEGDQLCAWASTTPYQDSHSGNCPIAARTIDALPPDGMVISARAYRSWSLPTDQLPEPLTLPDELGPPGEGGRKSLDIHGMTPHWYYLEISVNFAPQARLTPAMRSQAQAMVDRLQLPAAWPP